MTDSLISIVVPIFNKEKCLNRCIDSIIMQTYSNIEIILINDGSEDGSEEVCREYCKNDDRIKYYYQTNKGPSAARNLGIKQSKGEWVIFVDADDYVDEKMCEIALKYSSEEDSDLVIWASEDVCNERITIVRVSEKEELLWEGQENVWQLSRLMALGRMGELRANYVLDGPCCKMIHCSLIRKCCFPEGIDYGEDSCFCAMLYDEAQRVKWINKALYHRVTTEGSLSNRKDDTVAVRKVKFIRWLVDYWGNRMNTSDIEVFVTQNVANIFGYYVENSNLSFSNQRELLDEVVKNNQLDKYISQDSKSIISKRSNMVLNCYQNNNYLVFLFMRYVLRPVKHIYHICKYKKHRNSSLIKSNQR